LDDISRRTPGTLTRLTLARVREYMSGRRAGNAEEELVANMTVFYQTVFLHDSPHVNERTQRELRTLFYILDLLIEGHVLRAMDVLCQRVKSLEAGSDSGDWTSSRYRELVPEERLSLTTAAEKSLVERRLRDDAKAGILDRPRQRSRSGKRPGE
jgi:hypothetical protein